MHFGFEETRLRFEEMQLRRLQTFSDFAAVNTRTPASVLINVKRNRDFATDRGDSPQ